MTESRVRILVAEADDSDFKRIEQLLNGRTPGYELRRTLSAEAARGVIPDCAFDVCLVARRLGNSEGLALLPLILEHRPYAPVIMLAEENDPPYSVQASAAGAVDCLFHDSLSGELMDRAIRYALERRRAEKALAESEGRLRDLMHSASDWSWESDAEHRFFKLTGRFSEVVGMEVHEITGRRWSDLVARDLIHSDAIQAHARCLNEHRPYRDFVYPTRAGKHGVVWVRESGRPLFDDSGIFLGYRGTGSDATAEVAARRDAEVARNRLTDALRSIPDGFALYDANDRLALFNENYADSFGDDRDLLVLGVSYEGILRERLRRRSIPEAHGDNESWLARRLAERSDPEDWREYELPDGRWMRVSERKTHEGGLVTIQTDISEIKRREAQLRRSEERFRDLVDSASDWFFETDEDMRFTYVSENLVSISGYSREQLLGARRMDYLVIEETDPEALKTYQAAIEAREPYRRFIYTIRTAGGEKLWVSSSANPFLATGAPVPTSPKACVHARSSSSPRRD